MGGPWFGRVGWLSLASRLRRYSSPFACSRSLLDSSIPCILLSSVILVCYPPVVFAKLQSALPARLARHCATRVFSFTSFTSFASLTSSKCFRIRTSKTPLPQLLYNPHLQAPLGSAGNKGLITPLESALTENSPVTPVESALTKRWGVGERATSDPLGERRYRRGVIQTNRVVRARCGPRVAGIGTSRPGASPAARRYAWRSREGFCAAGRRLPPAIARGRSGPW